MNEPLNETLIDAVADMLIESNDVPLPGGHGTRWREARLACNHYLMAPGTVARCYVCLAILGKWRADRAALRAAKKSPKVVPSDNWSAKEWVLYATALFDQHPVVTNPAIAAVERWRYLIAGMLRVIERWRDSERKIPIQQQRDAAVRAAKNWAYYAGEGLGDLTGTWVRQSRWPALAAGPIAGGKPARDPLWDNATRLLAGHPGAIVLPAGAPPPVTAPDVESAERCLGTLLIAVGQMMICLHVFHANLGLPQPELRDAADFAGRSAFFESLFKLLKNSAGACVHCRTAQAVAAVLKLMPLVGGPPQPATPAEAATAIVTAMTTQLPSCFSRYRGEALLPLHVAAGFMADLSARQRFTDAWRLGEILADAVTDPSHVRRPPKAPDPTVPGFLSAHYTWPGAAAHYWLEARAVFPMPSHARPDVKARYGYFRQMKGGRMAATAHEQLPAICGHSRWPLLGESVPSGLCALCFIDH